jgi:hypothetical protein
MILVIKYRHDQDQKTWRGRKPKSPFVYPPLGSVKLIGLLSIRNYKTTDSWEIIINSDF